MDSTVKQNARAWDALVRRRGAHTAPARDEEFAQPLAHLDSHGWFGGSVAGQRVLCLGAGGGRQSALFAAAGALVTVVDISPAMLMLDRQVAAERKLDLRIVEASMDDLSVLESASFDVVAQPVSTCYVPDVAAVYREVARVLVPGGLYVSQHKQPTSLQAEVRPSGRGYALLEPYYRQGPLPPVADSIHRESGTLEFLHRLEALLGGLCRAGFVIEDVVEPLRARADAAPGDFGHRSQFLPPYIRLKARRTGQAPAATPTASVWLP